MSFRQSIGELSRHNPGKKFSWFRLLAALACAAAMLFTNAVTASPAYFSYWGLGTNIPESQDHVNLYWDVSWVWDSNEILSQLADAKTRGMRAMVHTEFA